MYFLSFLWISGWLVDLFYLFDYIYEVIFIKRHPRKNCVYVQALAVFFHFAKAKYSIARGWDQESGFMASVPREWLPWSTHSTGWDSDLSCSSQTFPWYRWTEYCIECIYIPCITKCLILWSSWPSHGVERLTLLVCHLGSRNCMTCL